MNQETQNVELLNYRCSKCINYRPIYIHPWSENIPDELKWSDNGFACLLPCNKRFMKSFNEDSYSDSDLRVDVTIGKRDSIGCECFSEPIENPIELIKSKVISIHDFPKKGVIFRDVTGILDNAKAFDVCNELLWKKSNDFDFNSVAGLEARGFIFGSVLAAKLGTKFVPIRKVGKLPRETITESYNLEYGTATIEMHRSSIKPGDRVLLVDDLLATGGTLNAAANLVERLGGKVAGALCVIELPSLNGRQLLESRGYRVETLCTFDGE